MKRINLGKETNTSRICKSVLDYIKISKVIITDNKNILFVTENIAHTHGK